VSPGFDLLVVLVESCGLLLLPSKKKHPALISCPCFWKEQGGQVGFVATTLCVVLSAETVSVDPVTGWLLLPDKWGDVHQAVLLADGSYQLNPVPLAQLGPGRVLGSKIDQQGNLIMCDVLKVRTATNELLYHLMCWQLRKVDAILKDASRVHVSVCLFCCLLVCLFVCLFVCLHAIERSCGGALHPA
jgi:hypothetical protein